MEGGGVGAGFGVGSTGGAGAGVGRTDGEPVDFAAGVWRFVFFTDVGEVVGTAAAGSVESMVAGISGAAGGGAGETTSETERSGGTGVGGATTRRRGAGRGFGFSAAGTAGACCRNDAGTSPAGIGRAGLATGRRTTGRRRINAGRAGWLAVVWAGGGAGASTIGAMVTGRRAGGSGALTGVGATAGTMTDFRGAAFVAALAFGGAGRTLTPGARGDFGTAARTGLAFRVEDGRTLEAAGSGFRVEDFRVLMNVCATGPNPAPGWRYESRPRRQARQREIAAARLPHPRC